MSKTSELMAIIESQHADIAVQRGHIEALMGRLTAFEASFRDQTTIPTPAETALKTAKTAKNGAATSVSGTIQKVAVHGMGLRLEGDDRWYNVRKEGKPIFLQVKAGQQIRLDLNEAGRVVMAYVGKEGATAPSAPAATTTAPAATTTASKAPATTTTKIAKDGTVRPPCQFCGGPAHNKYTTVQVRDECVYRQYIQATGNPMPDMLVPSTVAPFSKWVAATAVKAFAFNKDGYILVSEGQSAPTAPATTTTPSAAIKAEATVPPAPKEAAPAKNGGARGKGAMVPAKIASTATPAGAPTAGGSTVTPESVKADAAQTETAAASIDTAPSKPGEFIAGRTYKGLIAQQAKNTPGLVKFICAEVPGPKGGGTWLQASEKLTPAVVKLNVNDRVAFEFGYVKSSSGVFVLGLVRGKLLGDVSKETGYVAGHETSGKNQPAETKHQPTDAVVKKARTERANARRTAQEGRSKSGNDIAGSLVA